SAMQPLRGNGRVEPQGPAALHRMPGTAAAGRGVAGRVGINTGEGEHMRKVALGLAALFAVTAVRAGALEEKRLGNWHHWRGPNADGTAPKGAPPVTWDEHTHVKWKAPLEGRGSATPIVWGDRVFVLTAVPTDRAAGPGDLPQADPRLQRRTTAPTNYYKFDVLCFDRGTGKLRWRRTATEQVP